MTALYAVAIQARVLNLILDVRTGRIDVIEATEFLCAELHAAHARGEHNGSRRSRETKKRPPQGEA